jgi:hypothetical protein
MLIAREKRTSNIAEYVIYMWQVEDLIRANDMDIEKIDEFIISRFELPDPVKSEMTEWYKNLINEMMDEKREASGHLHFLEKLVTELNELHIRMINDQNESRYQEIYKRSQPFIIELSSRSKGAFDNEIDTCMHGLYGLLLLRLGKKKVSMETMKAFGNIGEMIALLANRYREEELKNKKRP